MVLVCSILALKGLSITELTFTTQREACGVPLKDNQSTHSIYVAVFMDKLARGTRDL